jgi:hypothetical protein
MFRFDEFNQRIGVEERYQEDARYKG